MYTSNLFLSININNEAKGHETENPEYTAGVVKEYVQQYLDSRGNAGEEIVHCNTVSVAMDLISDDILKKELYRRGMIAVSKPSAKELQAKLQGFNISISEEEANEILETVYPYNGNLSVEGEHWLGDIAWARSDVQVGEKAEVVKNNIPNVGYWAESEDVEIGTHGVIESIYGLYAIIVDDMGNKIKVSISQIKTY